MGSPPHLSPAHSTASPRRAVRLPPVQHPHQQQQQQQLAHNFSGGDNNNNNGPMYYSGQIHMQPGGSCLNQMGANSKPMASSYPGPESGPVANALDNLDLESAQIDFASIIDDQEPSSYSPINPPLGQPSSSSSQPSSRLTTPQTSIPAQPSGLSNMAVGDMTSMLTSLAGENKYLNTLS